MISNGIKYLYKHIYGTFFIVTAIFFSCISGYFTITNVWAGDEGIPIFPDGSYESNGVLYYYLQSQIQYVYNEILRYTTHMDIKADSLQCRFVSYISGIATVITSFFLGKYLKDSKLGLFMAFTITCNCAFIISSAYGRFYTLGCFLAILSTLALLYFCAHPTKRRAIAYMLSSILTLLGSMQTSIFFVFHSLIVAVNFRQKKVIIPFIISLILDLFCIGYLWFQDPTATERFDYGEFNKTKIITLAQAILCNGYSDDYVNCTQLSYDKLAIEQKQQRNSSLIAVGTICAILLFLSFNCDRKGQKNRNYSGVGLASTISIFIVAVFIVAFSIAVKNIIIPRILIFYSPIVSIALAIAMHSNKYWAYTWLSVLLLASPLLTLPRIISKQKADPRVLQWIYENYRTGDIAIIDSDFFIQDSPIYLKNFINIPYAYSFIDAASHQMESHKDLELMLDSVLQRPVLPYNRVIVATTLSDNTLKQYIKNYAPRYPIKKPIHILYGEVANHYALAVIVFTN